MSDAVAFPTLDNWRMSYINRPLRSQRKILFGGSFRQLLMEIRAMLTIIKLRVFRSNYAFYELFTGETRSAASMHANNSSQNSISFNFMGNLNEPRYLKPQ